MVNLNPLYCYRNLPEGAKRFLYIFVLPLKIAYKYWIEIQFDVYRLSGKGKDTNTTIKMLYITSFGIEPYLINLIYESKPQSDFIEKAYIWQVKRVIKEQATNVDFTFISIHKCVRYFLKFRKSFLIPIFIRQVLDINKTKEEIFSGFSKNSTQTDLRKILKFKYSYDIFSNLESLKLFYEKMHVPYVRRRYMDLVKINDFGVCKKYLEKGELIFVKADGQYISAGLCEKKDKCYYFRKLGVLNGDEELVKQGALAALYYFVILRAKEQDMKTIDFGLSRPFLSDGVLRFKRKWGVQVCQDRTLERLFCIILNKTKNAAATFSRQPFICIDKCKLRGVVVLNGDVKAGIFDVNSLVEELSAPGIDGFKVINLDNEKEYQIP